MSSISSSVTGIFNGGESSRDDKISIMDTSMVSQDMSSIMSPRNQSSPNEDTISMNSKLSGSSSARNGSNVNTSGLMIYIKDTVDSLID